MSSWLSLYASVDSVSCREKISEKHSECSGYIYMFFSFFPPIMHTTTYTEFVLY